MTTTQQLLHDADESEVAYAQGNFFRAKPKKKTIQASFNYSPRKVSDLESRSDLKLPETKTENVLQKSETYGRARVYGHLVL